MKKTFMEIPDISEVIDKNCKNKSSRVSELIYLMKLAEGLPYNSSVLEIGSFLGKSAVAISQGLEKNSGRLLCVDPCISRFSKNQEQELVSNLEGYNASLIKKRSDEFFKLNIEKYDMIFIDGDHSIDNFVNDLVNSIKSSRYILCGHDYWIRTPWIIHAIQLLASKFNISFEVNCYTWNLFLSNEIRNTDIEELRVFLLNEIRNNTIYGINDSIFNSRV